MAKNILIFSDGTGQSGGLTPDESRSNVYKLFRATRCGPENQIDPLRQFAFYDPGLGSAGDGGGFRLNWERTVYNALSSATGLGITRNIEDCYAAILRAWEPGDRIYLFGFSRGAYTARCVGGVLGLCGVPTKMNDGDSLKRDPATAKAIAKEAVRGVYQYGSSMKGDPKKPERLAKAARFRAAYGSDVNGESNGFPYFIGVWDTVAALGMGWIPFIVACLVGFSAGSAIVHFVAWGWLSWLASACVVVAAAVIAYGAISLRYGQPMSLAKYRMAFYDTKLNPAVAFARHAISIDENRRDFERVTWAEDGSTEFAKRVDGPERFKQVWFAGVHSDIGGGYAEPEARLSDIAFKWMVDESRSLPNPVAVDERYLNLSPQSTGQQHDERQSLIAKWPNWLIRLGGKIFGSRRLGWTEGFRIVPHDAPLHPSVIERLMAPAVLIYGSLMPYRPQSLRNHDEAERFYER